MSISGIGGGLNPPPIITSTASPTAPTGATQAAPAAGASGTSSGGFASALGNAVENLQSTQANADSLALQASTGSLTNVQDYMVAAEQASLQTQLTVAVRNNAVQAFQQIMGMQL